jgi:hypothetical protein
MNYGKAQCGIGKVTVWDNLAQLELRLDIPQHACYAERDQQKNADDMFYVFMVHVRPTE